MWTAEPISGGDLVHLRRCVVLAGEALAAGDEPFGSVLVGPAGEVLAEDRNRVSTNSLAHPEIELTRWALRHLVAPERAATTTYTSGEHCPMCSAAHAWAGLGRIVYATSAAQLSAWRAEWHTAAAPAAALPIQEIAPAVPTAGPAPELADEMRALYRSAYGA